MPCGIVSSIAASSAAFMATAICSVAMMSNTFRTWTAGITIKLDGTFGRKRMVTFVELHIWRKGLDSFFEEVNEVSDKAKSDPLSGTASHLNRFVALIAFWGMPEVGGEFTHRSN